MLHELLEDRAATDGDRTFFRFGETSHTFLGTRDRSAELAERLYGWGVRPGDRLVVDLPNADSFVFLLFAGSMLGVSFFVLNHRLTAAKKAELLEGFDVRATVDEAFIDALAEVTPAAYEAPVAAGGDGFIRMFTSGTSGTPKAACLTHANLLAAARSSASFFMRPRKGCWQLALPMFHVGGSLIVLRSLVNGSPFILYDRFDADAVLADVASGEATHVSVVDKTLRDSLAADKELMSRYEVILLGGGPANEVTLLDAAGTSVYASYGMTETCATVAAAAPGEHDHGMTALPGYELCVLEPDVDGVGEIAVAGPAVFAGYDRREGEIAGADPFVDGYFRTGDVGRIADGRLLVRERMTDLFISGGENVYPREIEHEILAVDGVEEAAVIGVEDPEWGRRPVAFASGPDGDRNRIVARLDERLSRFQRPDAIFMLDELPKAGIGKTDRAALAEFYENRLQVERVNLYRISQPLKTPFRTSQGVMTERESVIVEVIDHLGRAGYAEDVAFSTPWYTAETVDTTIAALREHLIPAVMRSPYLHPDEVFPSLAGLGGNLMAKGALEPACWDLYGRIIGVAMPELLAKWLGVPTGSRAPAGVSLGIMPLERTLEEVGRYVAKGYRRMKLKIASGDDVDRVAAVRAAYPDLMLMVDANRGYSADDVEVFRRLDGLWLVCIEEPIAHAGIEELSRFQDEIETPVCLDESIEAEEDLAETLTYPNLRNINLKIGKFGGVLPSLRLYRHCMEAGITLWLGGMYETGVSKYLHAQFETLPGFTIPGDISESERYFERDIVLPPVLAENGDIVLPKGAGLGFDVDFVRIDELLVEKIEVSRDGD
ncbi:MAG: o-succinylbenzoate synthase [Coriobacteriia bacterium]|nr:o-succinylbenzoate synthase [Coriobacteriia bacterium]